MTRRAPERVGTATTSGACALAVLPERPRPGGDGRAVARTRAVRPGRLTMTTRQIAATRDRDAEERAERTRLEVVLDRLDGVIDACERAHLDDLVDAPAGLAARAGAAIAAATAVVTAASEDVAGSTASRAQAGVRITEVMDAVWEAQTTVLDVLIPARRALPHDVPAEWAVRPSPAPPSHPAPLRRPVRSDRATADAVSLDVGTTWGELVGSAQRIWEWPVGSPERARLCAAYTRAVGKRMATRGVRVGAPRTRAATVDVLPPPVCHGCAHCGQWCEGQDAAGVRYCSTEHLLLARIRGVVGAGRAWTGS
jgi:hypothetical protein